MTSTELATSGELVPALIGGRFVAARDSATVDSIDPATGELLARFPRCGAEDVAMAVDAATEALPGWRDAEPTERAACLTRLADVLAGEGSRLAEIDSRDNGSPLHEMAKDVGTAVAQLRYFAGLALQARGETIPTAPGRLNYSLRQPYGVVGRIIPFNHPLMFAAAKIAAPLVAGNTVIIKPSEHTSLSALALARHLAEIFPPGVVNVITGFGHEAGDALVAHPRVRRLAFIGSAATGRAIQRRAAEVAVKHITLELGGKNPIVVLPDADQGAAVLGALNGMNFTWQGQSCGSTSRLLVHRDVYPEFVERLAARVSELRPGLPTSPGADTGAIVNQGQLDKVLGYIQIGRDEGARVVAGGHRATNGELERGLFVHPTVFADVEPDSRLAQEEIFGPVLAAIPYQDYDEAVRIANGVQYGLTASVFTTDLALAHRFARDVEAGYVWVNETSRHVAGTPFGGFKNSGLGREEDVEELYSYTQVKNVHVRYG